MPFVMDCEVLAHQEVAADHFRVTLVAPEIASAARAGMFCMIEVGAGYHPFLRRPFSIERIYPDGVSFLYKVEGEGTRLLSRVRPGDTLNIQGPLGRPFPVPGGVRRYLLVAGGIGVAPFPALAEAIIAEGGTPEVLLAARTERLLVGARDFTRMGCRVTLATDDGSAGHQGTAADLLEAALEPRESVVVYACGPMPMMRAVHEKCQAAGVVCWASLEAHMACGDGVCMGCVVPANREMEAERMVRVCREGPVFDTRDINWTACP
ncbi:MAG TPA: dihydroorotate dehydrogenase electron transfer subunit [Candidatus Hydrogenedentes bacterium]|nr:dihydroorotate dehydrogenase electron transfer subunit [Candidatus Hydrogenedentota bacterium]HOK88838.1 dihydroorotate dehydrogenase electron transfer subunit [Candidatus Hydrogenedentota bacterium]HOV59704.1 dihydroorotate dehydrogenase electron transfer subunit [Candidatus Hydrogenedentota bacterium]